MTGGQKVVAITVLAVFALVMFNLSIWRRMRISLAAAREETGRDGAERLAPDPALDAQRPADPPR